jgi:hypothetical protein
MPLSNYDYLFGSKKGAAQKALSAMEQQYGDKKKAKEVFYGRIAKLRKATERNNGSDKE